MFSLLPNLAQRSSYFQSASILHTGILFPLTALRTQYFAKYAEELSMSETRVALSAMAKDSSTYLIGGSFPERFGDKLYNTCLVHSPTGELISTHRKIHLFDICIPGNPLILTLTYSDKITFQESKVLSPGSSLTTFTTPWCDISLGICYDLRFPELAMIASRRGASIMIYPGAFNQTTGPFPNHLIF